jgi:hypothetical protein
MGMSRHGKLTTIRKDQIRGLGEDNEIEFLQWIESNVDKNVSDNYEFIADSVMESSGWRCKIIFALWFYNNSNQRIQSIFFNVQKKVIRRDLSTHLWDNIDRVSSLDYGQEILNQYSSIIDFSLNFMTHSTCQDPTYRVKVLNNVFIRWNEEVPFPNIFNLSTASFNVGEFISKNIIFSCDRDLLLKILKNTSHVEDKKNNCH